MNAGLIGLLACLSLGNERLLIPPESVRNLLSQGVRVGGMLCSVHSLGSIKDIGV